MPDTQNRTVANPPSDQIQAGPIDGDHNAGLRSDLLIQKSPFDAYGAFHVALGVLTGVVLGAWAFLILGISIGTKSFPMAGVTFGWLLLALGIMLGLPSIYRGQRHALWVLAGAFIWCLGLTFAHSREVRALWWYVNQANSELILPIRINLIMIVLYFIGARQRITLAHKTPSATKSALMPKLFEAAFVLMLLLGSTWAVPQLLTVSANTQTEQASKTFSILETPMAMGGICRLPNAGASDEIADRQMESCIAELEALHATGCSMIGFPVNGDCFLPGVSPNAREREFTCIKKARDLGMKVVLYDVPSPYLSKHPVDWKKFKEIQWGRIIKYTTSVRPAVYSICTGMLDYHQHGNISEHFARTKPPGQRFTPLDHFLQMWDTHLSSTAKAIKKVSPETQVAVTVEPWMPEEGSIYAIILNRPEIDILCLQNYGPTEQIACTKLLKRGPDWHPHKHEKQLWIMGTFYGHPLSLPRNEPSDENWLSVVTGWSQRFKVNALMVDPGGRFISGGDQLGQLEGGLAEHWKQSDKKLTGCGKQWKQLTKRVGTPWKKSPKKKKAAADLDPERKGGKESATKKDTDENESDPKAKPSPNFKSKSKQKSKPDLKEMGPFEKDFTPPTRKDDQWKKGNS